MKTPDGIKKGLECCAEDECFGERENCPYSGEPSLCVGSMCVDALAYIQQLEAERDAAVEACGKFPCESCVESENGDNCNWCAVVNGRRTGYVWRGVKENA